MVAGLDRGDAHADLPHDARAFMAQDRGENAFAVEAVERVGVGMADAGRHDFDQHLAGLWPFQVEFDDLERLLGFKSDGCTGFHLVSRLFAVPAAAPRRLTVIIV